MADGLEILPVRGIGEVPPGADLAALIAAAAPWLRDGDVLVVTSKIVSKAEGQLVDLPNGAAEREAARSALLAAETARIVASRGPTQIVQTHHGFVMAAAGIDNSNVDPDRLVLLPKDPDASARSLRAALRERHGLDVAVIVSDTMGRPWRLGQTDVALGAAGLPAMTDYRGSVDPYGNEMLVTQMAVIDELAGAAELVKGKFDGVPVAVVRGFLPPGATPAAPDGPGAAELIRDSALDLFSLGTAEARAAGLRYAAALPDGDPAGPPAPRGLLDRVVASLPDGGYVVTGDGRITCSFEDPFELGARVHRLRCALAADGLGSRWLGAGTLAVTLHWGASTSTSSGPPAATEGP